MGNVHKVKVVHEDSHVTRFKNNATFLIVKWILTAVFLFALGGLFFLKDISLSDKGLVIFLIIVGFLTIFAWNKERKLYLKRKRKYGTRWKPLKDPLIKELIAIGAIILIACWLIFS